MHDSYGDGWNGGFLEVRLNGTSIGTYAATGFGSTATFTVCNGDELELEYTAADWENENSYQLYGPFGSVIFADGPDPAEGVVSSSIGDCATIPGPGTVPCTALPIDTMDCVIADNSDAPGTGTDPGCANYQGGDIWYTMPIPASGNVSVSTFNTGGLNDTGRCIVDGTELLQPHPACL
ncbi:MAG: hypothetical protein IPG69_11300 [Flavobacteriales bacterium]|nr:hypothetical protein [Flavobacteriales bacterium]